MKTILAFLGVFLISSVASANETDMKAFFKALEGNWKGNGQVDRRRGDGSHESFNYLIDFGCRQGRENLWAVLSRVVYEDGTMNAPWANFTVTGDGLNIQAPGMNEPVNVTVSTSDMVAYTFQKADPRTGRVFDFTNQFAVCGAGVFKSESKAVLNGVIVTQDHFEAKKEGCNLETRNLSPEATAFCR